MGGDSHALNDESRQSECALLATIPLFGSLDDEELREVHSRCSRIEVAAGDWLMREGDPAHALFVVVHGRLRSIVTGTADEEMSRGHVIGEIGMLTGQVRAVGVRALRDSRLLAFSKEEFDSLAETHPSWMRRAAQIVIDRLTARTRQPDSERVLTITVFNLDASPETSAAALGIVQTLKTVAPTAWRTAADAPHHGERARWAHELEKGHRYVLFDAASGDEQWQHWCLRNSDRTVLITAGDRPPTALPPVLTGEFRGTDNRGDVILILTHPSWVRRPRGVAMWLDAVQPRLHLHFRRGSGSDTARIARIVTDRGIGLVLGGGGPRGFAHLGALNALEETGIPVDAVGGTSIGAIVGALKAIDLSADGRKRLADGFVGSSNVFLPTLPILSLSSARPRAPVAGKRGLFRQQID